MIVALNHKSNLLNSEFKMYQDKFKNIESKNKLIMCTTYINIPTFCLENCHLGAQNVSLFDNGAYTGEISAQQLKSCKVEYCIVGHSERRNYQKETDEDINNKIKQLLKNDITPILCVGESSKEKENNLTKSKIKNQIENAIKELNEKEISKIIVAYEPIWSIGTGNIPSNNDIDEVFMLIKKMLPNNKVLYGGSANEKNIFELKKCKNIDGYLLGGLSLNIEKLEIFLKNV